ncbi:hypothetical protein ACHAPI_012285 [Fusarium lateritium]
MAEPIPELYTASSHAARQVFLACGKWPHQLLEDVVPRSWIKTVLEKLSKLAASISRSINITSEELVTWLRDHSEKYYGLNINSLNVADHWLSEMSRTRTSSRRRASS